MRVRGFGRAAAAAFAAVGLIAAETGAGARAGVPPVTFAPGHIFLITGGKVARLRTGVSGTAEDPTWTVDGRAIVFSARADTSSPWLLYRVPAAGGKATALTGSDQPLQGFWPAASATGQVAATLIEFKYDIGPERIGILGGNLQLLIPAWDAAWAPDGRSLAGITTAPIPAAGATGAGGSASTAGTTGATGASGTATAPQLVVIQPDGTNERLVTGPPHGFTSLGEPAWSPNGTQLAFVAGSAGSEHVFVIGADGSSVRDLTGSAGKDTSPVWSPDGKRIALVRIPVRGSPEIATVRPDGSDTKLVATLPSGVAKAKSPRVSWSSRNVFAFAY